VLLAFRGAAALRVICMEPNSASLLSLRAPDLVFMKSYGRMKSVRSQRLIFDWSAGIG
jgi:hypothetical protein